MTIRRAPGTSRESTPQKRGVKRCELKLQDEIRLAYANSPNVRLFRNNNGVLVDRYGNYVTYGLGPGTSDLVGWRRRIDSCPHCGGTLPAFAQFAALEVKSPGQEPDDKQDLFLNIVDLHGGLAFWADSVEMALRLLKP